MLPLAHQLVFESPFCTAVFSGESSRRLAKYGNTQEQAERVKPLIKPSLRVARYARDKRHGHAAMMLGGDERRD